MADASGGESAVDRWPNRRIIFLAILVAIIFYAVFRLPATVNYLLVRARDTLILLILAVALSYFLLPAVDLLMRVPWPKRRRVRRRLAALIAIMAFTVLLLALMAVIVTPLAEEVGNLLRTVSKWAQEDLAGQINSFIDELLSNLPEPYRSQAAREVEALQQQFTGTSLAETLRTKVEEWGGAVLEWQINLIGSVLSSGAYLIALLIVPVFAYYFLTDATSLRKGMAMHVVPPDARSRYHRMVQDTDEVIQGYVKTVMLISVITGVATALTLYFAGVRVYLTFGILAGVANMVPVVGGVVAVVMITAISLLTVGLSRTLVIVLVYGAIQVVTDRVLAPRLMSEGAKLHPVAVILALLVGAEFFGMIGVFIAVPALAAARVAYIHYRAYMSDEGHSRELDELLGRSRAREGQQPPPAQLTMQPAEAEIEGELAPEAGAGETGQTDRDEGDDGDA
ncbi:MAG: AI-2E family transporter [Armatimonadota bacterium]